MKKFPLAIDQLGLYPVLSKSISARQAYNENLLITFHGTLDIEKLKNAINLVAARHESLRSVFNADGQTQSVLDKIEYSVSEVFTNTENKQQKKALLEAWLSEKANIIFDLETGPLYDFAIFHYAKDIFILGITATNPITDGISFINLARELAVFYENPNAILPQPTQFSEFVEQQYLAISQNAASLDYWQEILLTRPLSRIDLVNPNARPKQMSYQGDHAHFKFDNIFTQEIRSFCQKNRLTLFMVLFAAFALTLHHITEQNDFVIGIPFAYRHKSEINSCIGFCITILPLRVTLNKDDTVSTYLKKVRNHVLDGFENCYADFNTIYEKTNIVCNESRPFFFDVLFNLEKPDIETKFLGLNTSLTGLNSPYYPLIFDNETSIALTSHHAQFDFTANLLETSEGINGNFEYNKDLFQFKNIENFIRIFKNILQILIKKNLQENINHMFAENMTS